MALGRRGSSRRAGQAGHRGGLLRGGPEPDVARSSCVNMWPTPIGSRRLGMQRPGIKVLAIAMLLLVPLAGCQSIQDNPKTSIGGLIAAAAGGGGAAIAAGVIGGALLGGLVGNLLDQRDKEMQAKAASQAFESGPSGKAVSWQNPDSGHSGTVTPTRTYQTAQG